MKVLQACSGEETYIGWTGTIKRLIHRYLENRNKRGAKPGNAEDKIMAPYEGWRWCDATERALLGDIMNRHSSHL
jgi:hypothetical protein